MRVLPFSEALTVVKQTIDILEVVGRHVALKKAGRNYLGLCPFHGEKTPSFNVNREKNMFKCFGCGEHGDAIAFVMKLEHKTFPETIRELAQEQGIEIHDDPASAARAQERKTEQELLFSINTAAHTWFISQLNNTAHPEYAHLQTYLTQRKLDDTWSQYFGIGFAPPGWENLTNHLRHLVPEVQKTPNILETAGLATARQEQSGHYDKFRHRLIVPIHNLQGQVVAFGGRVLSPDDKPKYLNSPETPVYHKSDTLYAAHLAKESIRQHHTALIMEGYFDVMTAHMAGFKYTVGVCGTALTESHLKQLVRLGAETIILAFDADDAGLKAAHSAIDLAVQSLKNTSLQVKVLTIPSGPDQTKSDPDDFLKSNPPEAFQVLIDNAKPFLQFQLDHAIQGLSRHNVDGRVDAASRLTPILAKIQQPVLRTELTRMYAERMGISNDALAMEVRHHAQQSRWMHRSEQRSFSPVTPPPNIRSVQTLTSQENSLDTTEPLFPVDVDVSSSEANSSKGSVPDNSTRYMSGPLDKQNQHTITGGFRSQMPDKKRGKGSYGASGGGYKSKQKRQSWADKNAQPALDVPSLRLPPKHHAAELNLWRLMLYDDAALPALWPLVQSQTFETSALSSLQQAITALPTFSDTSQGLLNTLQNTLLDSQPDVVRQAFDIAFDADAFGQTLGLNLLTNTELTKRLQDLAWQQIEILERCQQQQRLQAMNAKLRESEAQQGNIKIDAAISSPTIDESRSLQSQLVQELRL